MRRGAKSVRLGLTDKAQHAAAHSHRAALREAPDAISRVRRAWWDTLSDRGNILSNMDPRGTNIRLQAASAAGVRQLPVMRCRGVD